METLGELIFGENANRIAELLQREKELTPADFQTVLGAITHSEMRQVYEWLKPQLETGINMARYSGIQPGKNHLKERYDFASAFLCGGQDTLLFSDESYLKGYLMAFCKMIERGYPDYQLAKSNPIGEITFVKSTPLPSAA